MVHMLITNKADMNSENISSKTPLNLAIDNGYVIIVKILLENGADYSLLRENSIIKIALDLIEYDKMGQKIYLLGNLIKEIYGCELKDKLDTLTTLEEMLKYSPDNTANLNQLKEHLETIGKEYFKKIDNLS